jgi:hypothetical protein
VSEAAWNHVTQEYKSLQRPLKRVGLWRAVASRRLASPWIAVWFTPLIGLADQKTMTAFTRADQALAWALIR